MTVDETGVIELPLAGRNGISPTASAAVLTIAATDATENGYVTVWPCGTWQPLASSLNLAPGSIAGNSVVAPIGADGKVCLRAYPQANLIVDVDGLDDLDERLPPADAGTPARHSRLRDGGLDGIGHRRTPARKGDGGEDCREGRSADQRPRSGRQRDRCRGRRPRLRVAVALWRSADLVDGEHRSLGAPSPTWRSCRSAVRAPSVRGPAC